MEPGSHPRHRSELIYYVRTSARHARKSPEATAERQVMEFYAKNAELKEQLRAPIFEEKTVDFILELAKVAEKSVTPEELVKAAREAEEDKPAQEGAAEGAAAN